MDVRCILTLVSQTRVHQSGSCESCVTVNSQTSGWGSCRARRCVCQLTSVQTRQWGIRRQGRKLTCFSPVLRKCSWQSPFTVLTGQCAELPACSNPLSQLPIPGNFLFTVLSATAGSTLLAMHSAGPGTCQLLCLLVHCDLLE